ncbi:MULTISPECIES: ABC-ATPase domain-containing protein [Pontibacillus]|uniref:ABC-ATPase domain-containing protein n=1 Tax=Pontibacillus chungwhensis TaxID=265426 RepID=A0ABY8UZ91_9BACI|nr:MULTISPECIES: ABC-ATPase domain-containing protein [Pontibacillus]MCD5324729.1 ABC-ATPase domain-containing protein [Pontibacillus sp. HN14]WIF98688.1 ABC-ATPase domain-containing protein [Pontibacillus chungwhensis]
MKDLQQKLKQIDGKSYKAYKDIQGRYTFQTHAVAIDYVQGDPFAAPSKIRLIVPSNEYKIASEWMETSTRLTYIEDLVARHVARAIAKDKTAIRGSGKSGAISIDAPGQEILERTAVSITEKQTEICLSIGLPANGRRINGKEAEKLFLQVLPSVLKQSLLMMKDQDFEAAAQLADQHDAIRAKMKEEDWISFVADESILPRESGISNRPMKKAVPFTSPEENRVSFTIPHRNEPITGMALKKGIVLIVGGGYHGKSTLLKAIERGVYPHIKGDGREYVLTDPDAVKVRAEDGRQVSGVNISPFINHLPHGEDTVRFSTENASGSTSQAANVMEAIEAEASTLLIDEDTSATNFMIRDARMQELVAKDKEPITPFIDQIKRLRDEVNVSTILVMGGSGDYFDAADDVIMLDQYLPYNVTEQAKEIAQKYPFHRDEEKADHFKTMPKRHFLPGSLDSRRGKKSKVQAKGRTLILLGRSEISLHYVEQLVSGSQTRMIAEILHHLEQKNWLKDQRSFPELLDAIEAQLDQKGLASFTDFKDQHPGDLARPRRHEIAATLNRLRTSKVDQFS